MLPTADERDARSASERVLDEEALVRWGRAVGAAVGRPVFVALRGELGAGKSVLARAIGAGAGVTAAMPSPTFNLLFRYALPSGGAVVHLDLYRIAAPDEVWELGWGELGAPGEIVLVEWPERAEGLLPADRWDVELRLPEGRPRVRTVRVRAAGAPPPLPPLPATGAAPAP